MKTYLPDTNVLAEFGRNPDIKAKLEKARGKVLDCRILDRQILMARL